MDTTNHNEIDRPNNGKHQRRYNDGVAVGKPLCSEISEPPVKFDPLGVGKASRRLSRLRVGPSLYERLLAEEVSIRESFARR